MSDADRFRIFVVEDDDWYRELLAYHLEMNPDYEVIRYENANDCLNELHLRPSIITLDYGLPDMNGKEVLKQIKETDPGIEVLIVSGQEDISTALELLRGGAYDYFVKEKDIQERLLKVVNNIRQNADLKEEIVQLKKEIGRKYDFSNSIIGQSPAIIRIFDMLEKAVKTNITVSVTGETGTGKELVAKAIHFGSKRSKGPFIPVNIPAIPADLIESELFGHEKGSFTGATSRRVGKFEQANGGTLFLDEIGEMEISLQAKILRALQEKEFTRIGGTDTIKTDCRIIVATNRNLMEEVKAGNFREDLYYRLFGLPIELPPLRERGKDIILLAKHFLDHFVKENELEPMMINASAQKKLLAYHFPGNVRELKSIIELAAVMSNENQIDDSHITFTSKDVLPELMDKELTLKAYNEKIVKLYLDRYNQDIKLVAQKLDIGVSTIYRMLKKAES